MNYSDAQFAYSWWSTGGMTVNELAQHFGVTTDEILHAIDVVQDDNEAAAKRAAAPVRESVAPIKRSSEDMAVAAYVAEGLGEW